MYLPVFFQGVFLGEKMPGWEVLVIYVFTLIFAERHAPLRQDVWLTLGPVCVNGSVWVYVSLCFSPHFMFKFRLRC